MWTLALTQTINESNKVVEKIFEYFYYFLSCFRFNFTVPSFHYELLQDNFGHVEVLLNIENSLAFTINIALILILTINRKLRQNHSNVYLASLCLTYLCIAISHFTLQVSRAAKDFFFTLTSVYAFQACCIMGSLNLILVTMDRFLAVRYPFLFERQRPIHALIFVISVAWIPSILFMVLSCVYQPSLYSYGDNVIIAIVLSLVILLMANIYNFVTVRKLIALENGSTNAAIATTNQRCKRAAYVCFAIVFVFTVNWFPECVILFLSAIGKINNFQKFHMMRWSLPLVASNSILGPIVYVTFTKDVRKEIKDVVQMIVRRFRQMSVTTHP